MSPSKENRLHYWFLTSLAAAISWPRFYFAPNISWDNLRAHGWMLICTSLEGATAYGGASLANRSIFTSDVYPCRLVHIRHISMPVGPRQTCIRGCWSTSDISVPVGPRQTYISACWSTPDLYPCLLAHVRHISVHSGPHQTYIRAYWSTSDICPWLLFHVRYIRVCWSTSDI